MSDRAGSFYMPRYIDGEDMGDDITGRWLNIKGCSRVGFGMVWEDPDPRDIVVINTDHVVKATKTWTFANGAFSSADVGGTFTIAGTGSGGANDGTYTINSVTNATTVVSTEAVPGANETFAGTETLSLQQLNATGEWVAEVCYDFDPNLHEVTGPIELVLPTEMTDEDPAAAASDTEFEFQGMTAPWFRLSYTATSGGGILRVGASGKGF